VDEKEIMQYYIFRLGVRDNTTGLIGTVDTHVSIAALPPQTTKE
jgi:hypothetical protein